MTQEDEVDIRKRALDIALSTIGGMSISASDLIQKAVEIEKYIKGESK